MPPPTVRFTPKTSLSLLSGPHLSYKSEERNVASDAVMGPIPAL